MDSDALVCFQQTRRGAGERWFKVYRVDLDGAERLVDRLGEYVSRTHFEGPVTPPHWFDTGGGPVLEGRLAEIGEKLVPFAAFNLFVATQKTVEPFLAVPVAVDLLPVLSEAVRAREYAGADCDTDGSEATLAPAATAEATRVVDADTFETPLSGPAAAGGSMEWFHLVTLRAAYRLLAGPRTGVVDTDGEHPTMRVPDGEDVLCVDLLDAGALKRLPRDLLFVNYGALETEESLDARLTAALRETARLRYRFARHLWNVRAGETDERFAEVARNRSQPRFADEHAAAHARFLEAVAAEYGTALAPFGGGSYGAALRWATGTRADTFTLSEPATFDHDAAVDVVADVDPGYVPEAPKKRF